MTERNEINFCLPVQEPLKWREKGVQDRESEYLLLGIDLHLQAIAHAHA
jgi:hypothetical protein